MRIIFFRFFFAHLLSLSHTHEFLCETRFVPVLFLFQESSMWFAFCAFVASKKKNVLNDFNKLFIARVSHKQIERTNQIAVIEFFFLESSRMWSMLEVNVITRPYTRTHRPHFSVPVLQYNASLLFLVISSLFIRDEHNLTCSHIFDDFFSFASSSSS